MDIMSDKEKSSFKVLLKDALPSMYKAPSNGNMAVAAIIAGMAHQRENEGVTHHFLPAEQHPYFTRIGLVPPYHKENDGDGRKVCRTTMF